MDTPEIDFLLQITHFQMDEDEKNTIRNSAKKIDETVFLKHLKMQGIAAIVYKSLINNNLQDIVSPKLQETLKKIYVGNLVSNSKKFELLGRLRSIIGDFVVLKGGQILPNVYNDLGIRLMSDLDILVPQERAIKTFNALKDNGFKDVEEIVPGAYKSEWLLKLSMKQEYANHLPAVFFNNIMVEIHSKIFGNNFGKISDEAFVNAVSKNGMLYLSPDYNIVYLCKHFYFHGSKRKISQLVDIREFILKFRDEINWKNVENIAISTNLTEAVTTTLNILQQNFGMTDCIKCQPMECIDIQQFFTSDRQTDKSRKIDDIFAKKSNPKVFLAILLSEMFPSRKWLKRKYGSDGFVNYCRYWGEWFS